MNGPHPLLSAKMPMVPLVPVVVKLEEVPTNRHPPATVAVPMEYVHVLETVHVTEPALGLAMAGVPTCGARLLYELARTMLAMPHMADAVVKVSATLAAEPLVDSPSIVAVPV